MFYNSQNFGNLTRQRVFITAILLVGFILLSRLVYLQVINQDRFVREARSNSIRDIPTQPIRGNIIDRNGRLIVDNYPFYSVTITPKDFLQDQVGFLSKAISLPESLIVDSYKKAKEYSGYLPSILKRDIDFSSLVAVEENLSNLSGVGFRIDTKRHYPTSAKASHVLGYMIEASREMIKNEPIFYENGDLTGGSGLESYYEKELRGKKGHEFWMVNATGQILGQYENGDLDIKPVNGNDLYLTIDANLQAYAENLMEGFSGGLVAMDPQTGEILSMVSKPDFDLNVFSGLTPKTAWNSLRTDNSKPLYNRATLTRYPPGSTFKPIVALYGLEKKIITPKTKLDCKGVFYFGDRSFKCHGGVHGKIDVGTAIEKSCNSFFYQLILQCDLDDFQSYLSQFGLGTTTEIDLFEKRAGLIPSTDYYNRVYGVNKWTRGYLISLGIGQGEIGISPLQSAQYISAIANGGKLVTPHLVRQVYDKEQEAFRRAEKKITSISVNDSLLSIIRMGMRRVVMRGTATAINFKTVEVAGKTGTSQNPHGADHSWFVCFAPFENPEIVISVLVENGGFGATSALPVARDLLAFYFNQKQQLKQLAQVQ